MQQFDDGYQYRQRLLLHPGEREEVDYKAAIAFDPKSDFGLNLFRHLQGMANTGGGTIVIGYRQPSRELPSPDPGMTTSIAASYEPTILLQAVNSTVFRGQALELKVYVEPHPESQVLYPLITVHGHRGTPIVCRSTLPDGARKPILRAGAVYVRRPGAETTEASKPEDYEGLIRRAQQAIREDFLHQLRELVGAPPLSSPSQRLADHQRAARSAAYGE